MTPAFLSVGFRPFYLGAAGFALIAAPLWIWQFAGVGAPLSGLSPLLWHGHEMVFGFAPAVIVGFLLTAVRNWTGRPTPEGLALAGLFGCWLLARVANFFSAGVLPVLLDGGFLLWALAVLVGPILRSGNRRNYFVIALLAGLAVMSVLHGLAIRGVFATVTASQATRLAMDLVLLLMVVIGGRVIPAFSMNAVRGLEARTRPTVEIVAMASPVVLFIVDLLNPGAAGPGWALVCSVMAAAHLVRLAGWQVWKTYRNPLLLALPAAYLWIPAHLLLRAFEPASALHALTLGAMASLMLAMMTRSALGHTGRALVAGSAEKLIFLAMHLAAVSRVFAPLAVPAAYMTWLWLAAGLWLLAFGTFAIAYWPMLTQPRLNTG